MRVSPHIVTRIAVACAVLGGMLIVAGATRAALPFSSAAAVLAVLAYRLPRYTR